MSMRHRYPETSGRRPTTSYQVNERNYLSSSSSAPSTTFNQGYHDAVNWFQKRKTMAKVCENNGLKDNKDENMNRAQTAPSKPKLFYPELTPKSTQITTASDRDNENKNDISRPSTGKLVRQCLKCKILYTVSHYCTLNSNSNSTPSLLQPTPLPVTVRKRAIALSEGAKYTNPYTRYRTTPDPIIRKAR